MALQSYTAFLRQNHTVDLAAEALRVLAANGQTPDSVAAPVGGSAASRMVAAVEQFLNWLDNDGASEIPLSQSMGVLHQQAMLAFLDRYTKEPQVILEIVRALAAKVGNLAPCETPGIGGSAHQSVSKLAHDLRSPLNALSGALNVLGATLEGPMQERTERMLAIALRNTDRLAEMIDDWAATQKTP